MRCFRILAVATTAILVACGSESPSDPGSNDGGDDGDNQPPVVDTDEIQCGEQGYPCSLSQVSLEVLERTDELGDSVLARLDAGMSMGDIASWLEEMDETADVESDAQALRFRLKGGRGIWILRDGSQGISQAPAGTPPRSAHVPQPGPESVVVGPGAEDKKALVLAPMLWAFGAYDDGAAVEAILSSTRGYEGRVDYLANDTKEATKVGLESYMSWDAYDVVHVSTHGDRLCSEAGCRAVIMAVELNAGLPDGSGTKAEKLHELAHDGVTWVKYEKSGEEYLALTADFFRKEYPGGLDDTVVFLNACRSFASEVTDLVDAIRGTSSVVFGWSEAVFAEDATAASTALWKNLGEDGYTTTVAHEKLGTLRTGRATEFGGPPSLLVTDRGEGGDLRIRDIVTLLNPAGSTPLSESSDVAIEGTAGDGEPDGAPWAVRIDGVSEDEASDMMLYVSVDGDESEPVAVSSGEVDDEDRWTVRGVYPLSYDVEDDTPVTFNARVTLSDDGESEDAEGAVLTGAEPIMGHEWELVAEQQFFWTGGIPHTPYGATAHLTLAFADDQATTEPHPRYVITGGTVTFDYNHTYYDCSYSAPVVTFDPADYPDNTSELFFDTTTDPVGYSGTLYTVGPDVEVTGSCGDAVDVQSEPTRNTWLKFDPSDGMVVSADGESISGTYRTSNDFTGYSFVVESTYTITRVR